jgi:Xaa-Pro aminopeptidase
MTETERRLDALRRVMRTARVDLIAIAPTDNMRYLAGYVSHPDERLCLLLISADRAAVVVPRLNSEEWERHSNLPLYTWEDHEGPRGALTAALSSLGLTSARKLAVDGEMRADFLLPLMEVSAAAETVPLAALNAPLRLCKSPDEVEALQRAAEQADGAMSAAVDACRPGVTEAQVAWAAAEAFRLDGAEQVCFTLIASGPNGAAPHHHSGDRAMQDGDAVIIDIGASLNGYKSDITRVVFLGEPTAEFLTAYDAVLLANECARAAVKPGIAACDVDRAARSTLEAAGYGQFFIHRTGHGLGLSVHEAPWIMAGDSTPLEEGMVFSIEPGVYLPGRFGIRIEDIVVVTEDGGRRLTGFDHRLVVKS